MTVGDAIARGRERLLAFGDDGRFDALRLLEEMLEREAAWLLGHRDDALDAATLARYDAALARRVAGEPVAYIIGRVGFYGRTFRVTPAVLVPRPETEQLVALALEFLSTRSRASTVCDVGTGSGVLAITLACESPKAEVTAIDISPSALKVARGNARALGVAERVRFHCGDLLEDARARSMYDLIVANLPYVRTADLRVAPDSTAHEPKLALDGGADGLDAYRRFLARAGAALAATGLLLMEAGPETAEPLARLAAQSFGCAEIVVHRDYSHHERVVEVRRSTRS